MTLILLINTDHYNQRKSCSIRVNLSGRDGSVFHIVLNQWERHKP